MGRGQEVTSSRSGWGECGRHARQRRAHAPGGTFASPTTTTTPFPPPGCGEATRGDAAGFPGPAARTRDADSRSPGREV
jgi:hypothetical protein